MDNFFSLIADQLELGIIVLNSNYEIRVWNGWLERLTGNGAKEVTGKKLTDICPRFNQRIYHQILEDAILHGKNRFCSGAMHRYFIDPADESHGPTMRQNMLVQPVQTDKERFILIQIFDVTSQHQRVQQLKGLIHELTITHRKLKASKETIRYQAYHDFLTGLPNRLLLLDRLNLAIAQAQRNKHCIAILFLDLDNFKEINDTMGHGAGDRLLQEIALRLTGCVRKSDTVARFGGDEFVLLLPEILEPDVASVIAIKIINAIVRPWIYQEQEFIITASAGISFFPHDGEKAEALIKNADNAMFRAKELGKNNVQFFNRTLFTSSNNPDVFAPGPEVK